MLQDIQCTTNEFKPAKHVFIDDQCGINSDLNLTATSTELDFLSSLFTGEIAEIMVHETNCYTSQSANG